MEFWSFSTQVAQYDVIYFTGYSEGHHHKKKKDSSVLVQGQVGSSGRYFSK